MPARDCTLLKLLVVLKRREGGGFDRYYNRVGNYDSVREFLGPAYGWRSWQDLQDGRPGQLPGYVACQMRPKATPRTDGRGVVQYGDVDYSAPFAEWKLALRHQPHELPGWAHVAEVKAECLRLLPEWAGQHIIAGRQAEASGERAVVGLAGAMLRQGGNSQAWLYRDAAVQQQGRYCRALLFDRSQGCISGRAELFDQASVELLPGGEVLAFDESRVVLRAGPHGETGTVEAFGEGVQVLRAEPGGGLAPAEVRAQPDTTRLYTQASVNQPFGLPVD